MNQNEINETDDEIELTPEERDHVELVHAWQQALKDAPASKSAIFYPRLVLV